jgi:hypothetical protein
MKNHKAQIGINNIFLFTVLIFSGFVIFCAGFLNFDTESADTNVETLFGEFSFGNILQATTYAWFNILVLAPILIVLGIILYDKLRGIA